MRMGQPAARNETSGNERDGNETGYGGSLRPRRPYPLRRPPTTLFGGKAWLGADLVVGLLKQNIAAKQASSAQRS
jgi:hypothetical protein